MLATGALVWLAGHLLSAYKTCQWSSRLAENIVTRTPLRSVRVLLTTDYDRLLDGVDLPPLLSVQEAADRLGISRQAVLKAISAQRLPAIRVGGTWIVRESSVRALSQRSA